MKYYIIAGEASGDLHGSNLMKGLKQVDPQAEFRFWGGDLMAAQGGTMVKHYKETAIMGFWEVLKNLSKVTKNLRLCKEDILKYKPDVVILIDYPGFNFRIAEFTHKQGIKTFYYIAPKVWAWKKSRVKRLQKDIDKLFIIFPFEIEYFKKWNIDAIYRGNPLIDSIADKTVNSPSFSEFIEKNKLPDKPIIAFLAGSRKQEIKHIVPRVKKLVVEFPGYQLILAAAPSLDKDFYAQYILPEDNMAAVYDQTYDTLKVADVAIVASGTATLETALLNTPQVVCYAGSEISYQIAKFLVKGYISLVNIIMNAPVVKELIQHDMSLDKMKAEIETLLFNESYRNAQLKAYQQLQESLGEYGSSKRVAEAMVKELKKDCRTS
ncbi:MAG: lipid-A-disaccharide synthase [Prevotellaceae bacterium]|jgi:lipid-A-disaccharide synthase|nr:lipid-A-disaccharide synthase [Prevotellaceae bacterium]